VKQQHSRFGSEAPPYHPEDYPSPRGRFEALAPEKSRSPVPTSGHLVMRHWSVPGSGSSSSRLRATLRAAESRSRVSNRWFYKPTKLPRRTDQSVTWVAKRHQRMA